MTKKLKKSKKKNRKKQQGDSNISLEEPSSTTVEMSSLKNVHKFKDLDEKFSCKEVSPEHCEELRNRKFTNKKEDLFLEVRSLEERFKFTIHEEKKTWDQKLAEVKEKNISLYRTALFNKEKALKYEVEELKVEIEENIHALETQEHMVLSQIDMVYNVNKDKMIEDLLAIIGLHF